jgi:hypothetical protein
MSKNNIFLTIQLLSNIQQDEGKSQVEAGKIRNFLLILTRTEEVSHLPIG